MGYYKKLMIQPVGRIGVMGRMECWNGGRVVKNWSNG
jgi:hypothetical protein